MFLKKELLMLPTNNKSNLKLGNNNLLVNNTLGYDSNFTNQHLYVLSDEEIKEGDWYLSFDIHGNYGKPISADYNKTNEFSLKPYSNYCKKIITTTDKSLMKIDVELPQSFIEKYVEEYYKGNKINFIPVEYYTEIKDDEKIPFIIFNDKKEISIGSQSNLVLIDLINENNINKTLSWLWDNHQIWINVKHTPFDQKFGYSITGGYYKGENGILKSYDFKKFITPIDVYNDAFEYCHQFLKKLSY